MKPLRPLDVLRLLRDPRCKAKPMERLALMMIVLRADNATWKARFSFKTIAADMGVARRTAITLVGKLGEEKESPDVPIVLTREQGRKVNGHRRATNAYTIAVRAGWALDSYENGDRAAPVIDDHQSASDRRSPTLVQYDHHVGDPVAQVLPSALPIDLPNEKNGTRPAVHKDPETQAIFDRIRRWPIFEALNADRLADEQAGWMLSKGQLLAWVLDAIDAAATKCPDGATYDRKHSMLVGYMHSARRPRDEEQKKPSPVIESKGEDPAIMERLRRDREAKDRRIAERLAREAAQKAAQAHQSGRPVAIPLRPIANAPSPDVGRATGIVDSPPPPTAEAHAEVAAPSCVSSSRT